MATLASTKDQSQEGKRRRRKKRRRVLRCRGDGLKEREREERGREVGQRTRSGWNREPSEGSTDDEKEREGSFLFSGQVGSSSETRKIMRWRVV